MCRYKRGLTLMHRRRVSWTVSKLIRRITINLPRVLAHRSEDLIMLTAFLNYNFFASEPQQKLSSPRRTPPKIQVEEGVALLSRKPAISLKRGKIGPRLLLMTNRKSHSRFRLVPKSTTLDDLEGPLRTLFQNTCVFRSPPRKFE